VWCWPSLRAGTTTLQAVACLLLLVLLLLLLLVIPNRAQPLPMVCSAARGRALLWWGCTRPPQYKVDEWWWCMAADARAAPAAACIAMLYCSGCLIRSLYRSKAVQAARGVTLFVVVVQAFLRRTHTKKFLLSLLRVELYV
jgi:hypothetical protein